MVSFAATQKIFDNRDTRDNEKINQRKKRKEQTRGVFRPFTLRVYFFISSPVFAQESRSPKITDFM